MTMEEQYLATHRLLEARGRRVLPAVLDEVLVEMLRLAHRRGVAHYSEDEEHVFGVSPEAWQQSVRLTGSDYPEPDMVDRASLFGYRVRVDRRLRGTELQLQAEMLVR